MRPAPSRSCGANIPKIADLPSRPCRRSWNRLKSVPPQFSTLNSRLLFIHPSARPFGCQCVIRQHAQSSEPDQNAVADFKGLMLRFEFRTGSDDGDTDAAFG